MMYFQGKIKRNKQTTNMSCGTQQRNQAVNNKPIAKRQTRLVEKKTIQVINSKQTPRGRNTTASWMESNKQTTTLVKACWVYSEGWGRMEWDVRSKWWWRRHTALQIIKCHQMFALLYHVVTLMCDNKSTSSCLLSHVVDFWFSRLPVYRGFQYMQNMQTNIYDPSDPILSIYRPVFG